MPKVQTVDPEAQQREAEAKAQQQAARDNATLQRRRQRSALSTGQGSALSLYGGGNQTLGGQ